MKFQYSEGAMDPAAKYSILYRGEQHATKTILRRFNNFLIISL